MPTFTTAFTPPPTIEGLTATASGAGVVLTWDPTTLSAVDFVAYHVQRSAAGGSFVELVSIADAATTTFTDYAAPLGVQLVYRVSQESLDYSSEPAEVTTLVDACEFWLVLRATGQQLGFEVPNVAAMQSVWPMQSVEHEPLGRPYKLVESGELLGEESTVEALLLPDQANVAQLIRQVAARRVADEILWKTPYGDVHAVAIGSIASSRDVGGRQTLTFRTIAIGPA